MALALAIPPFQQGVTMSNDAAEIQAVLDRYEAALNNSDANAALALYAHDGVFMPSSAPTAVGTEEVKAAYEFVFSTIRLDIKFLIDEIVVDGSSAYARTRSKGTVTVLANDMQAPEENRELFLFDKRSGAWKISRYIFNKTS
jgi:uncharacterized protein (TIGR02246 family)